MCAEFSAIWIRRSSHSQDLEAAVVTDGDPVGLCRGPLDLVDLASSRVGQDRVLDGTWHLLDVPDQRLVVVRCKSRANDIPKVCCIAATLLWYEGESNSAFRDLITTPVNFNGI